MRKLPLLLILAFCLKIVPATSQNQAFKNAIHAKLNFIDYGLLFDNKPNLGQGFEFAYFRNVAPALNVGVPLKLGLAKLPGGENTNTLTAGADIQFRLENIRSTAKIIPFAFGGAGFVFEKDNSHAQFPFGAGLHFRLSPYAFINLQGEFRKALVDDRDNLQIGIGYVYLLHKSENQPATTNLMMYDKDRDGTPDSLDVCPTLAGTPTALGCPDADNDGIGDSSDPCPNDAGTLQTSGCPDYDNDGVADKDDECPTEGGSLKGCPDTDLDGVANKDDKCPDVAGIEEFKGCPQNASDADGDGTPDEQDLCPDKAGTNKGCPDTDGDGIADNYDNCPELVGTVELNGCPDTDRDGVADDFDHCPELAGSAKLNGCPDTDGDGVADNFDHCPEVAGSDKMSGCPDTDGDGLADNFDHCPKVAGSTKTSGCPDTDGDGIADIYDRCPELAGIEALNGCPDTDRDGVNDNDDKCPEEAGLAKYGGCPDTDGDDVPDNQDKCPNEAGTAKNNGCPEPKPADRDSDGVPDKDDPCPNKAGSFGGCPDTDGDGIADNLDRCPGKAGVAENEGCPEEKKPVVKEEKPAPVVEEKKEVKEARAQLASAARLVQFESAKAILKDASYDKLDEVVALMRKNASYSLSISGYTDDVGDDETNLRLSQDRAKACYDYLIFRGIKAERIRFAGFGEARPIATNDTAEGRELNRRVEFELILE